MQDGVYASKITSVDELTQRISDECVFNLKSKRLFASKPTQIAPLGIRVAEHLRTIGFSHKNSTVNSVPSVPPWLLRRPRLTSVCTISKE